MEALFATTLECLVTRRRIVAGIALLLTGFVCLIGVSGCQSQGASTTAFSALYAEGVAPYSGQPAVEINSNEPFFADDELNLNSLEEYSEFDALGRCGVAIVLAGPETMPTASRGSIGMIKPSGWQIAEYDWIDGKYLFNRCHLIAYSLAGENDNSLNLITGTRTMNVQGMLPYEERVASYVDRTGNHVLYRVTPVFEGDNLVASGVLMEAQSVEDEGAGIRFCVWCYNVEPGVVIDYATGNSRAGDPITESYDAAVSSRDERGDAAADTEGSAQLGTAQPPTEQSELAELQGEADAVHTYILNKNTHRFHYPDCPSVADMKEKNKQVFEGSRDEIIAQGYRPCGVCQP